MFPGPKDRCLACGKPVFTPEKIYSHGMSFHRACFKCSRGGNGNGCPPLTAENHCFLNGDLYCDDHFVEAEKAEGDNGERVYDLHKYAREKGCTHIAFALPDHVFMRGQEPQGNEEQPPASKEGPKKE